MIINLKQSLYKTRKESFYKPFTTFSMFCNRNNRCKVKQKVFNDQIDFKKKVQNFMPS